MSSSQARHALERLREEIAALERCRIPLTPEQSVRVTTLRIRRNLLMGLLVVRAMERPKKVVNLARWRWGFAAPATMQRYGLGRGDAESNEVSWDRGSDPFAPEAG